MFDAGEYAAYVWPAYGATALVIGWLVADSLLRARKWRRRAESRKSERGR